MIRLPNKICWCLKIITYSPVIYLTGRHVSTIYRHPKDFKVKSLEVKHCLCCLFQGHICFLDGQESTSVPGTDTLLTARAEGDHRPNISWRVFSMSCQPELCKLMTCSRGRLCPLVDHPPVLPPTLAPHWHWCCVPFPPTPLPLQAECTGMCQGVIAKCYKCMAVSCYQGFT